MAEPVVLGEGVIEQIVLRYRRGEIDLATARQHARRAPVVDALTPEYARALASWAFDLATRNESTDAARALLEVLLASTEALPDDQASLHIKGPVELNWVNVCTVLLTDAPDWRVYTAGHRVGRRLLERGRAFGDRDMEYAALHALGSLHLDPLVAHQAPLSWMARMRDWYETGEATAGPDLEPFPPLEQALERALEYYRQASDASSGVRRGRSLKAQVQALEWLGRLRNEPQIEMPSVAAEALEELDPERDLTSVTYLLGILEQSGTPLSEEAVANLTGVSIDGAVRSSGLVSALVALTNLISLLVDREAAAALELAERVEPLAGEVEEENVVANYLHARLIALARSMSDRVIANDEGTLAAAKGVLRIAEQEGWNDRRVAGALLDLANGSSPRDEEEAGLQLLDMVCKLVPEECARHAGAVAFLRTSLCAGAATNAYNGNRPAEAAAGYAQAIHLALQLGLARMAAKWLQYFVDAAVRGGEESETQMLLLLFALGPRIETALGADGVELLQNLGLILTIRQTGAEHANADLLHLTWQVSKGSAFGSALAQRAAASLASDEFSDALLAEIAALREDVPLTREGTGPGSRIDRMLRVLTFLGADTPSPGATPIERMANLQHRFDRRLEERLVAAGEPSSVTPLWLDEMRNALEPRTAVLNLYLGNFGEGRARFALLASRDAIDLHVVPDRSGLLLQMREGERTETAFSYAADAFAVRRSLAVAAPDPAEVAATLDGASEWIIGGLAGPLAEFRRRGCDHLCIVPHGPMHNLPLHLMAANGGMLADEWTVTVIPTLELLRRGRDPHAPKRAGLAAFGVSFADHNPYHLAPLPEAADEAERVAAAFGTRAVLNADVTERAVLEGLGRARYVHIATHGALNLDAPAFQYLVVTPDDGGDGLLYAHEMLSHDFRGVELITLSACETVLGRVDRSDNPRGLAASLLLAGAEAIVGTLWETRSDVARAFFVELYRSLRADDDRRAAFRAAQVETRRRFPDPWDWGAFYYVGSW